jgi:outer membrane protein assembly factor BamE (lipoprotein component of BamABCDE complex)
MFQEPAMNTIRFSIVALFAALMLGACNSPKVTEQQVKGVVGLNQDQVEDKIGSPSSTTNAGDSIWWEYVNVDMGGGRTDGDCHVVFKNGLVTETKCQ